MSKPFFPDSAGTSASTSSSGELSDIARDLKLFLERRHLFTIEQQVRALQTIKERLATADARCETTFESITGIMDTS